MSTCGAGAGLREQMACRFFKKSSFADRCMHYSLVVAGHCDCVDAQRGQTCMGQWDREDR
jgi:hypothetical protein